MSVNVNAIGDLSREELEREYQELQTRHVTLKVNVRETARKYATQHNLCSVVENALQEAGLNGEMRTISVEGYVPFTATLQIDSEIVDGMDEEALLELVKGQGTVQATLNLVPAARGGGRNAQRFLAVSGGRITPREAVLEALVDPQNAPAGPHGAPLGYVARGSADSRVLHYFSEAELNSSRTYTNSLCGRYGAFASQLYDWDASAAYMPRVRTEEDGSPVICKRCAA